MDDNDQVRLFGGGSLAGYLDAKQKSAISLVEQFPQEEFLATSPVTLVAQIVEQLSVAPLVLQMEHMQRQQSDTKISKEVDGTDYGMPVRREVMVRGTVMRYLIPFTIKGDATPFLNG